jgi:hypothetical protein
MEPAIPEGAAVTLCCGEEAEVGDVVAYVLKDRLIVHRVVAVRGALLFTRGDADLVPDPVLTGAAAIVGRVVRVEWNGVAGPPPPAPESVIASTLLALCLAAARVGGAEAGIGVARRLRRVRDWWRGLPS